MLDGNGIGCQHKHDNGTKFTDVSPISVGKCKLLIKWDLHNIRTDTIYSTFVANDTGSILYNEVFINSVKVINSYEDNQIQIINGVYPTFVID